MSLGDVMKEWCSQEFFFSHVISLLHSFSSILLNKSEW